MNGIEDRQAATQVVIVSSNYLLRLGLQRIVETEKSINLLGHVTNWAALDEMLVRDQPHIVIIDTEMKDVTCMVKKVKTAASHVRIILLSSLEDPECTRQAIDFAVDGIVLKVQPSAVLLATIRYLAHPAADDDAHHTVAKMATRITATEVSRTPGSAHSLSNQAKWPDGLTEREREVIKLISQGLSNKDIADRLSISSITVRHHLTSIFDKLGVSNRQKLLLRAHQYGIEELTALA